MKENVKHWSLLRLASLPLIPLFFYFLAQMEHLTTRSRADFINWLQQPLPAFATLLFIACAYYHAYLGTEEIIEDYISSAGRRELARRVNKVFFLTLSAAAAYAVLLIYCGRIQ